MSYEFITAESEGLVSRVVPTDKLLEDQKEGMAAFVEKRKPKFKNR